MQKGLGSLGTLLVVGLGLGLLRGGSQSALAPSAGAGGGQRQRAGDFPHPNPPAGCILPDCAEKDLLDAITESSPEEVAEEVAKQAPEEGLGVDARLMHEFQRRVKGNDISFAVAIVPDPLHTHLSLFFDRSMDAIHQGAQQAGWIFDRATMPWDSQTHAESTDFRIRQEQQQYEQNKEALPGLLIFRGASPENLKKPLYIFVVGEAPTGGINKDQFRTALNLIANTSTPGNETAPKTLRIIGPTFSGSLYSLAQLIDNALSQGKFNRIVIRSGTISSWNSVQWFQGRFEKTPQVDFATFQNSDRYMLRAFIEFEKRRGYLPDKIAVLAEDETAYGDRGPLEEVSKPNPCPKEGQASPAKPSEGDLQKDENCVLQLYFPRDISELRSAYQQGQGQASSSNSYQIRSTLPLNLQDTGSDDDSVQQYAHSQTPLSQESILLGIIAAIRDHNIQFVVLQATNPIDTVFLAGFLKKGYSDARVVAAPADLLLSRDVDDVSLLHGVMALTTYSLLPGLENEAAVPDSLSNVPRVSHVFPAAYSSGTFNATLSQITCVASLPWECGCDSESSPHTLPVAHYTEYGWPAMVSAKAPQDPLVPVVWLTVLGRNGFWPVAVLDHGEKKLGDIQASPRSIDSHATAGKFTPPWPLFWKIACGVVLLMSIVFWTLLGKGSIIATSAPLSLLAPVKHPCRSGLIAAIGWLLLTAILLLAWPWMVWLKWQVRPVIFLCAVVAVVLFHCGYCAISLTRRGSNRGTQVFLLVAALLIGFFAYLYKVPGHSQNLFLYRYIHLTSGVSPLLPLLCLLAAGLWWAWFSLSGLALLDQRHPQLPLDTDLPTAITSCHTSAAVISPMWPSEAWALRLLEIAQPCARHHKVYLPTFAVLGVALVALDYGHPLLSLETRHFEWAYTLALAAVALAVFGTLFRLLAIWLECRRILTVLDHSPLRRAFAQVNLSWEPFWRIGGARWQDLYRLVSRQLETLDHLQAEIKDVAGDPAVKELVCSIEKTAKSQNQMRTRVAGAFQASSARTASPAPLGTEASPLTLPRDPLSPADKLEFSESCIDDYAWLQRDIAKTCASALKYLQPKWWSAEGLILCEIGSNKDQVKDDDSPDISLSTRLAERFVALVYINFILSVVLRMRTLWLTAGGLYIFLLLSVNSYPFEPKVSLRSAAILLLMFIVGMVGYVSAQVHRDSILSLVTNTKPGELGIEFWVRMGSFIALPLISLLVSQFPTLNNALFSWLEPAANALKQ